MADIGVIGWWHQDNQGDSAMLESLAMALAPHRVVPIDTVFEVNGDVLQRLNLLDFLILGGGTLFRDRPSKPFDTFDSWGNQLRTPTGIAGLGVDGLLPNYFAAALALINQARFFYVRDRASQRILEHPKVQVAPDLTFAYPLSATVSTALSPQHPPVCGINLRVAPGLEAERWIETLRGLPLRWRGIPFSSFEAWQEIETLRQLDDTCATAFDPALYNDLDLMIGTAYHSVIFAIQAAVPVIAIAYARKVRRLMSDVGLEDYVLEPDEWPKLPALVERAVDEHGRLVEHLQETTATLTKSARQMMGHIREEIEKTALPQARRGPRVSIVAIGDTSATANQATLASCLNQTYQDVEVIFVGDVAQAIPEAAPCGLQLKVIPFDPAESLGERLNRAFACATGEYLSWIVAGHFYARDAVGCMLNRLQQEPACDMVYAEYYTTGDRNRLADAHFVHPAYKLCRRNVVGPCFLYSRRLGEGVGFFKRDSPLPAYDYWLRAHRAFNLQLMHVRLFYATKAHKPVDDCQAERRVRREWRSTDPWLLQTFWSILDTKLADRYVIRPLMTTLRKGRSTYQHVKIRRQLRDIYRTLSTVTKRTDISRWRRVVREDPLWDERNRIIAGLIPENSSVLDLGSGAQTLRKHLKPGCEYQPCDIIQNSSNVLFCDFNAGIYPAVTMSYDYAVCSGVLEYIRRPQEFLAVTSGFGIEMFVSYAAFQEGDSRLKRASEGWTNHFTQLQLENLFDGLELEWSLVGRWNNQLIYRVWRRPKCYA
jgi:polysaccharide pyruvyl transferase WcaK-like protein/glycosyltransferase involved in cell wall biosynthesis